MASWSWPKSRWFSHSKCDCVIDAQAQWNVPQLRSHLYNLWRLLASIASRKYLDALDLGSSTNDTILFYSFFTSFCSPIKRFRATAMSKRLLHFFDNPHVSVKFRQWTLTSGSLPSDTRFLADHPSEPIHENIPVALLRRTARITSRTSWSDPKIIAPESKWKDNTDQMKIIEKSRRIWKIKIVSFGDAVHISSPTAIQEHGHECKK